jgi:hypothetical protein
VLGRERMLGSRVVARRSCVLWAIWGTVSYSKRLGDWLSDCGLDDARDVDGARMTFVNGDVLRGAEQSGWLLSV